jgi:hypothetical protein
LDFDGAKCFADVLDFAIYFSRDVTAQYKGVSPGAGTTPPSQPWDIDNDDTSVACVANLSVPTSNNTVVKATHIAKIECTQDKPIWYQVHNRTIYQEGTLENP